MPPHRPLDERFWEKVARGGTDECWEWTASRNPLGYGLIGVGPTGTSLAHRVSWTLANGPIPVGLCVLHSCDNPPCCNPGHLFLGTRTDNAADCVAKGRTRGRRRRGEAHQDAKITTAIASAIRREYVPRVVTTRMLAAKYGLSHGHISKIVNGLYWPSH